MPDLIDGAYFVRRAAQSRRASEGAAEGCARMAHAKLASAYQRMATASAKVAVEGRAIVAARPAL